MWTDAVHTRLFKILKHGKKDADSIKAMDMWAKLSGNYAPQEYEIKGIPAEERKQKYAEIVDLVEMRQKELKQLETTKDKFKEVIDSEENTVPQKPTRPAIPEQFYPDK